MRQMHPAKILLFQRESVWLNDWFCFAMTLDESFSVLCVLQILYYQTLEGCAQCPLRLGEVF